MKSVKYLNGGNKQMRLWNFVERWSEVKSKT